MSESLKPHFGFWLIIPRVWIGTLSSSSTGDSSFPSCSMAVRSTRLLQRPVHVCWIPCTMPGSTWLRVPLDLSRSLVSLWLLASCPWICVVNPRCFGVGFGPNAFLSQFPAGQSCRIPICLHMLPALVSRNLLGFGLRLSCRRCRFLLLPSALIGCLGLGTGCFPMYPCVPLFSRVRRICRHMRKVRCF